MSSEPPAIHPTAVVEPGCHIGAGTHVWHFCQVRAGARIGRGCSLGKGCYVAPSAVIGDGVKVQNQVSIYDGVIVEDEVFLGPSCVLTNVRNPRAAISRAGAFETTRLCHGCTIGANATVVCGITVGRYAMVGAGAVVTGDVPDYALMVGTPARQLGWVGRRGVRLGEPDENGVMRCPESGEGYLLGDGVVQRLEIA